jgi:hypothetical protein
MAQKRKLSSFRPAWIEVPAGRRFEPEFTAALSAWRGGDHRAIVRLLDEHGLEYGPPMAPRPSLARLDVPRTG